MNFSWISVKAEIVCERNGAHTEEIYEKAVGFRCFLSFWVAWQQKTEMVMKLQVRGYPLPSHPLESMFSQIHSQEQNPGFCLAVISSPNMHRKRSNRRVIFKRFASVLTCWKRLIFLATAGGMSCSHWELRWNGIHKSELSSWSVLYKFGKVFCETNKNMA